MNDDKFKSLIRSYLKKKISSSDMNSLRRELKTNAERKHQFDKACRDYQKRKRGSSSFSQSGKSSSSSKRKSSRKKKTASESSSSGARTRSVSNQQLLIYSIKMGWKKFIHVTMRKHYMMILVLCVGLMILFSGFYAFVSFLLRGDDEESQMANIESSVKFKQEAYGDRVFLNEGMQDDSLQRGFKKLTLPGHDSGGSPAFKYEGYEYNYDTSPPVINDPVIYQKKNDK